MFDNNKSAEIFKEKIRNTLYILLTFSSETQNRVLSLMYFDEIRFLELVLFEGNPICFQLPL